MILLHLRSLLKRFNFISKQTLQLLMGVLVGFYVLTQTTVTTHVIAAQDQQEQESEKETSTDQLTISEAVTLSGSQINLGFQSILLEEVAQDQEVKNQGSLLDGITLATQKALKILFSRIISTNAP